MLHNKPQEEVRKASTNRSRGITSGGPRQAINQIAADTASPGHIPAIRPGIISADTHQHIYRYAYASRNQQDIAMPKYAKPRIYFEIYNSDMHS